MVQTSQKYQQYFLQPLVRYVCDKQGEVRQAAAYGIGVMAQFGGQGYLQAYTGMFVGLIQVCQPAYLYSGGREDIKKTVSVLQYCVCTVIIVHKGVSSSYRLVDSIGL